MAAYSRRNVAKALSVMGLKKTFIAVRSKDAYSVNRLVMKNGEMSLKRIATFRDPDPRVIGRVGMPDSKLAIGWRNSMTFYGGWFDDLASADTDYRIRNNILALSRGTLMDQVKRDDKYGLIGSYYAVFLQVLEVGKGIPMILLDDSLLGLASFPVIVPTLTDSHLEKELGNMLRLSLKRELDENSSAAMPGISVSESDSDAAGKFFREKQRAS